MSYATEASETSPPCAYTSRLSIETSTLNNESLKDSMNILTTNLSMEPILELDCKFDEQSKTTDVPHLHHQHLTSTRGTIQQRSTKSARSQRRKEMKSKLGPLLLSCDAPHMPGLFGFLTNNRFINAFSPFFLVTGLFRMQLTRFSLGVSARYEWCWYLQSIPKTRIVTENEWTQELVGYGRYWRDNR